MQPKLNSIGQPSGQIGGRSHSGSLVNNANAALPKGLTMGGPRDAERRKISLNYSTQLPTNNSVQAQQQIMSMGGNNYGHNTHHQLILNPQSGATNSAGKYAHQH